MIVSIVLLVLIIWGVALVARSALVTWQVKLAAEGRSAPLSFALGGVPVPVSDTLILALGASLWKPAKTPGAVKTFAIGRRTLGFSRGQLHYRIDGRERHDGGLLMITDKRVAWRGRVEKVDVPLTDVAHLEVRAPLIVIRLRSRPNDPLVVKAPHPVSVAQLIVVLSAKAMGLTVSVTPSPAPTSPGRRP